MEIIELVSAIVGAAIGIFWVLCLVRFWRLSADVKAMLEITQTMNEAQRAETKATNERLDRLNARVDWFASFYQQPPSA